MVIKRMRRPPQETCPNLLLKIFFVTLFPQYRNSESQSMVPLNECVIPPVIENKLREIFGRALGLGGIPSGAIKLPEKASTGFFASTLEACLKERIFPRR